MSNPVFIFKVALQDCEDIWRRIAARGNQTLNDLHWAIFKAFDRDDEHLYSFYFPTPGATGRNWLRNAVEYTHPYGADDPSPFGHARFNAAEVKLSALELKPGQVFLYVFDFGDEWWHEITVEQIEVEPKRGKYPRVVERHGKSPPQYPDMEDED